MMTFRILMTRDNFDRPSGVRTHNSHVETTLFESLSKTNTAMEQK
jgi:hypothetical protein